MTQYKDRFYKNRHANTVSAAKTILDRLLTVIPRPQSAVDVGCGVGTWLSVLKEHGVGDIQGVDGPWVDKAMLEIPTDTIIFQDLTAPINLDRKFDLAISLEVAEHLPERWATQFVSGLTQLSDIVLFAAAVPYQGGTGHVNEQWPGYWVDLFAERGYIALDVVRKHIWENKDIPKWYRQNTLLYVKKTCLSALNMTDEELVNARAPEDYLLYYNKLVQPGIRQSFFSLLRAVAHRFWK